jgi:EamA domain-containing membrane protein RarD
MYVQGISSSLRNLLLFGYVMVVYMELIYEITNLRFIAYRMLASQL